jgi:FdhD protein
MSDLKKHQITRIKGSEMARTTDVMAVEEPLEIILKSGQKEQNISITMRTPGSDKYLAAGFLFTEGIIQGKEEIEKIEHLKTPWGAEDPNRIKLSLTDSANPPLDKLERHFYTSSSCGVCGKSSIDAIRVAGAAQEQSSDEKLQSLYTSRVASLPSLLRSQQAVFEQTGGLHACAWFDEQSAPRWLSEDVGRHNALDKLIGKAMMDSALPLRQGVLLLSGRASFELIQKAVMAGMRCVAAVGAPSSLAVELAEEFNVTLIGFLKADRMNVYTHPERMINDL